ncbi:hypothetical protein TanjilG_06158 [Lupinus angustifolius]|uniref:Pectinesterase inhibitor domain-containing protein n=1 Tax=Lupinus angustifolius TaxID=3871 RepID=A0A394DNU0_LUPAN|nr:PREDICTED: uncharacterized protein LOC109340133 [Lupinus angustifolius]OIW21537.1 hypothetical protein TanjilG_06158 [Lupinus angustifolius]
MNPSTFLSILFTLSLIFISHSSLSASIINFKLYQVVCIQYGIRVSPNIKGCLEALQSDPRIPSAENYIELSIFILEQAIKNSTLSQIFLKNMMKTDPSPAIKECATQDYTGIINAFENALANVLHDPQTAINYLHRDLGYAEGKCSAALKDDPKPYFEVNVLISHVYFYTAVAELSLNHLIDQ